MGERGSDEGGAAAFVSVGVVEGDSKGRLSVGKVVGLSWAKGR